MSGSITVESIAGGVSRFRRTFRAAAAPHKVPVTQIWIQKAVAPIRNLLPRWAFQPIRGIATGLLTPLLFSYRSGHLRSSLLAKAVRKNGEPLPWYTYPSIDFLQRRPYADRSVLEFGAGQSTLWWAKRAKQVLALEGDKDWHARIRGAMPRNVELHLVSMESAERCVEDVERILEDRTKRFDVIVVDGLYRREMAEIAKRHVTDDGIIVCDNAEGYGIYEAFKDSGLDRVDFYGHAPGVVLPHATAIYFRSGSFPFSAALPISVIATEG